MMRRPGGTDISAAVKRAVAWFESLTPVQQAEHRKAQAQSWARGEAGMGSDADEAEYRAALLSGDRHRVAACEDKARERVARVDAMIAEGRL